MNYRIFVSIAPLFLAILTLGYPEKILGQNQNKAPQFELTGGCLKGTWTQVGQDIEGLFSSRSEGFSVSLSANGLTLITAAPNSTSNFGRARIFSFDDSSDTWIQIGQDIRGARLGDRSGASVALSADGMTAIIGSPRNDENGTNSGHTRIFNFDTESNIWTQLGESITGAAEDDQSGASVALSADGLTAIIGAPENDNNGSNSGHARIFRFDEDSNTWSQLGQDIDGEAPFDLSGFSVALSSNGLIAIIGARGNDELGSSSGHARVFQFDSGSNTWNQLGQDLDGESAGDFSGGAVSLSRDGLTACIGSSGSDANGEDSGHVRIFRFDQEADTWIELGSDIVGKSAFDLLGAAVDLSADGLTAIVGAPENDANGDNSGLTSVFRFDKNSDSWIQLAGYLIGESAFDRFGSSLALSADGLTTVVGATGNDGNGSGRGHTRAFRLREPVFSYDIAEKTTIVTDVETSDDLDVEGSGLIYTLSGADASMFTITPAGILSFVTPPDFQVPTDFDSNNIYEVDLTVTDSQSASSQQALEIIVQDTRPIFPEFADVILFQNESKQIEVTPNDFDTELENVSISVSSDNQELIDNSTLILSRRGDTQFLSLNPSSGRLGSSTITLIGSDGANTVTSTFKVSVTNAIPQLSFTGGTISQHWNQLGQSINGENEGDGSGCSVALSADGLTTIIGASTNDTAEENAGHARVFHFDQNLNDWIQLGQDIDGEAANDFSGGSVDLSADGLTAIIGAEGNDENGENSGHARVFRFEHESNVWKQLGQDIDGEAEGDFSGDVVALSADGLTAIIGAPFNQSAGGRDGHARVFRFDQVLASWIQLGQDIDAESSNFLPNISVALSSDGLTAIVGAAADDGNGRGSGHARIFRFDPNSNLWIKLGPDIEGEARGDAAGRAVDVSADGLTAIVGAPNNSGNGDDSGHARVFRFNQIANSWTQLGQDINGEAEGDDLGFSVGLSADGLTAILGAKDNDDNGDNSGHARIFRFDQSVGRWVQLGNDIDGEGVGDKSGSAVDISADGRIAIIGALRNDGNGDNSGHARIFQLGSSTINYELAEQTRIITNVSASDDTGSEGFDLNYSLSGVDASLFEINPAGILSFRKLPEFQNPADFNADNIYEFNVIVTDAQAASSQQALAIKVIEEDRDDITDIEIIAEILQSPLVAGGPPRTTFQITAINHGPQHAENLIISQNTTLPAGVTLVSAEPSVGSFTNGNWYLDLRNQARASLTFTLQADASSFSGINGVLFGMGLISIDQFDDFPANNSVVTQVPVISAIDTVLDFTSPSFDSQSNIYSAILTLSNNGSLNIPAARVFVLGLPADAQLTNASGITARGPYLILEASLEAGQMATITAEFSRDIQDPNFTPAYELELLSEVMIDSMLATENIVVTQARRLASGDQLIEIASSSGAVYDVQYSSDLLIWRDSPQVIALSNRLVWIDSGLPKTARHPQRSSNRYYRFRLISAPDAQ